MSTWTGTLFSGAYSNHTEAMSQLLSGPNGQVMPIAATLYGNQSGLPSALGSAATNPNVQWQPVPVSGTFLSNIYSPVVQEPARPAFSYLNNGTIASGPYTSNSVRTFNVVSQNDAALIPPPAWLLPSPSQYRPTVMGSLSKLSAAIPSIGLQNAWYPADGEPMNSPYMPPTMYSAIPGFIQTTGSPWTRPLPTMTAPYRPRYGFGS